MLPEAFEYIRPVSKKRNDAGIIAQSFDPPPYGLRVLRREREKDKMSCEYETIFYETETTAVPDENGDPIPETIEVPVGSYCHYKEEYNQDCSQCDLNR